MYARCFEATLIGSLPIDKKGKETQRPLKETESQRKYERDLVVQSAPSWIFSFHHCLPGTKGKVLNATVQNWDASGENMSNNGKVLSYRNVNKVCI